MNEDSSEHRKKVCIYVVRVVLCVVYMALQSKLSVYLIAEDKIIDYKI